VAGDDGCSLRYVTAEYRVADDKKAVCGFIVVPSNNADFSITRQFARYGAEDKFYVFAHAETEKEH
jgi:hypothetical protein